jgi:ubiquinone/menaquinone biosynthesis C-methylase UbiE
MKRFDHFRLAAPIYDRVVSTSAHDRLHDILDLPPYGSLLDAGGGTGRVSEALCGHAARIVVADVSGAMLRRTLAKPCLLPVQSRVERLPFLDATFDRVLVVDAFHHFGHHWQTARELMRVLKPGGWVVVEEPDIGAWPVKVVALGERLALMRSRFFAAADMRRMFEQHGGAVRVYRDGRATVRLVVEKRAS